MPNARPRGTRQVTLRGGVTMPPQYFTGMDLFQTHTCIACVLVYPQGLDDQALAQSLPAVLRTYPMLCGRIKRDAQGHDYLDSNDAGMTLRVQTHPGPLPAFGVTHPLGKSLRRYARRIYPWQLVNRDQAPLEVEIHQFADGGALLTISCAHSVADGATVWNFIMDWVRAHHGHPITPPTLDRQSVIDFSSALIRPNQPMPLLCRKTAWARVGIMARFAWQYLAGFDWVTFRIPAEQLARWKQDALASQPEGTEAPATQDLVVAACLKRLSPHMRSQAPRHIGLVTDMRFRRHVGLSRKYVGNAIGRDMVSVDAQVIEQQDLGGLARLVHRDIDQVPQTDLLDFMGLLEHHRQQRSIASLCSVAGLHALEAGLIVNNSAHFPANKIDWGGGPPSWHEYERAPYRRLLMTPSPQRDGGIDVNISAPRHELKGLREWQTNW